MTRSTILSAEEYRAVIMRVLQLLNAGGKCVEIGDGIRAAIIEFSSTKYLSVERELYEACRVIRERVPGEFPLCSVRAAE